MILTYIFLKQRSKRQEESSETSRQTSCRIQSKDLTLEFVFEEIFKNRANPAARTPSVGASTMKFIPSTMKFIQNERVMIDFSL